MCSTFKGYAAARVLQMAQHGELTLDRQVFVDPAGGAAQFAEDRNELRRPDDVGRAVRRRGAAQRQRRGQPAAPDDRRARLPSLISRAASAMTAPGSTAGRSN